MDNREKIRKPLTDGTILDERYRILRLISEDSFGYWYQCENIILNQKVSVKEYFREGYLYRNAQGKIVPFHEDDEAKFAKEKESLLKEAGIIHDYPKLTGLSEIKGYFEENNTVYVVNGYITGKVLSDQIKEKGRLSSKEVFTGFIPIMKSLAFLHKEGVIHRDINTNNIIVTDEGRYVLTNFGAARISGADEDEITHTMELPDGFMPSEMYDKDSRQGPWTDIYAIAASIYQCITGIVPPSALERIFNDELIPPTELDAEMDENLEEVLLKALSIDPEKRYKDLDGLISDIEAVYPSETVEKRNKKRYLAASVLVLALVTAAVIIISLFIKELRFFGVKTETVYFTAPDEMSDEDFHAASELVRERFELFAGKGNYIWDEGDRTVTAVSPLSCYHGLNVDYVLRTYLVPPWDIYTMQKRADKYVYHTDDPSDGWDPDIVEKAYDYMFHPVRLPEQTFTDIELKYGTIPDSDTGATGEKDRISISSDGPYYYFEAGIDEEKRNSYTDVQINEFSPFKSLGLSLDVDYKTDHGLYKRGGIYGVFGETPDNCYLLLQDRGENFHNVARYALTHAPIPQDLVLEYSYDYDSLTDWEKVSRSSLLNGDLQKNVSEILGDSTTVVYQYIGMNASNIGNINEGQDKDDFIETMLEVKDLFDRRGIPYAFGVLDSRSGIAVRFELSKDREFSEGINAMEKEDERSRGIDKIKKMINELDAGGQYSSYSHLFYPYGLKKIIIKKNGESSLQMNLRLQKIINEINL
ncbi:MAG: serine/threonine protein kinase [Lachnospiraceae bacterium]|nr:serine/threonine protein kinase [Lachnospiraceae bacterium]